MKKFILLSLFAVLFTTQSFSQSYKPKWGTTKKIEGGSLRSSFELIGIEGDHYYVYNTSRRGGVQLIKYSMDHKLVSDVKLELDHEGEAIFLSQLIQTSKGTYACLYDVGNKKKEWGFFTSTFNDGDFGPVQKKCSFNSMEPESVEDRLLKRIKLSKDKNQVAFVGTLANKDKKAQEELFIALFDAEMNLQWKKNQVIPFPKNKTILEQVLVGNDGTIYLSMHYTDRKTKRAKGVVKYDYKLFAVTENDMREIKIDLEDGLIPTSIGLFDNDDSKEGFSVAGLFMPNVKKNNITGAFSASGNKNSTTLSNIRLHHFDKKDEKDAYGDKAEDENYYLYPESDINGLFTFSDGSFGFASERSFFREQVSPDGSPTPSGSLHEFVTHSIAITIFSKSGEFQSVARIGKGYSSITPEYCSYTLAEYNDKLYFVFNDAPTKKEFKALMKKKSKSKGKKGKDKKSGYKPMLTDMAVVNKVGEVEFYKTIFTNQTVGKEFMPRLCDYSNGKFLVGAANMGKYRFGLINLEVTKK